MATPMFIFGGNTGVASPKELKRLRSIAEALNGPQRAPQNIGEGLNAIGQALLYRSTEGRAERMEREGQESAAAAFNPILDALSGKPTASGSSGNVASALFGQPEAAAELAATSPKAGSTFTPFIDTVKAGGLTNPYGLAAVASTGERESGWSPEKAVQTWSDPSESGQPGRAGGIMSWRGPRYQALAAAGDMSPEGQARFFLNENPQLIQALNGAKSVEEAQGLINKAWAFAGYDRPGGEAARRLSLAHGYLPQFQGQGGTQVASLDPAAGMTTAAGAIDAIAPPSGQPMPQNASPAFDAGRWGDPIKLSEMPAGAGDLGQRLGAQANSYAPPIQNPGQPTPQAGGLPELPFRQVGPTPQVAGQPMQQPPQQAQPPVQVAQAQAGPSLPQLYQALQNPWLNEGQQQMILGEIQRQQQMADPMRQMQLRKSQLDLEQAENGNWARLDDGRLFNQRTGEVRNAPAGPAGSASDLGLNPQYGVDTQGNPVILQLGKNGQVVQSKMPEGVKLAKEPIRLDAGTHFVLLDPLTRQPVGTVPKDNRGAAFDTAGGKADAEAISNLPQAENSANQMLSTIDSLSSDPYLDNMVGSVQGKWLPNVTSDAARVQSKMDQIGGQSFLQAFESLKGGGQITEIEGQKATQAIGRLNTAQSEKDYREALAELRSVVMSGLERARARAGGKGAKPVSAPSGPVSIGGYKIEQVD